MSDDSKAVLSPPNSLDFQLDRSFTHRLHTLHKLTDRVSQHAYLQHTGLPMAEGRCLASIGAFRPLSVNDLAQRANLNKAQASRAAQSLVDQELVSKVASRKDARGVVLTLTAQGEQVWRKVMAVIEERNRTILSCLDPAQQTLLDQLLDQLVQHAQSAEVGESGGMSEHEPAILANQPATTKAAQPGSP